MTDHLPECFYYMDDFGNGERCICDRLRACEQRMIKRVEASTDIWSALRELKEKP